MRNSKSYLPSVKLGRRGTGLLPRIRSSCSMRGRVILGTTLRALRKWYNWSRVEGATRTQWTLSFLRLHAACFSGGQDEGEKEKWERSSWEKQAKKCALKASLEIEMTSSNSWEEGRDGCETYRLWAEFGHIGACRQSWTIQHFYCPLWSLICAALRKHCSSLVKCNWVLHRERGTAATRSCIRDQFCASG